MIAAVLGLATILLYSPLAQAASGPSGYGLVKTIPIGGEGKWDYCVVDAAARRVYVSHGTHFVVLDADSGAVVGDIPDTLGVHGIALTPELGRGFISARKANTVVVFDLKTLQPVATVKSGGMNPDAVYYDARTKRVFAFNGRSANAVAINATDSKALGMIPVGAKPELVAGDDNGHVFVNIEDKSQLLKSMRKSFQFFIAGRLQVVKSLRDWRSIRRTGGCSRFGEIRK
jgi:DNA-binding beta-propeller fold protein YncE